MLLCSSCTPRNTYFIHFTTISASCSLSSYLRNSLQAPDGYLEEPDIFHISSVPWHAEPLPSPQFHTSSVLLRGTEFCLSIVATSCFLLLMLSFCLRSTSCVPRISQYIPSKSLSCNSDCKSSNSCLHKKEEGKGKYPDVWFWLHVWPRRFQEGVVINFTLSPSFDKSSRIHRGKISGLLIEVPLALWPCSMLSHKLLPWRNGLARGLGLCLGIRVQFQDEISVC